MAALCFLSLMLGIDAKGCFFFVLTVLCFQYMLRVIGFVVDRPHKKQKVVVMAKAFLGAVFDALLVLASLKQDALMRSNFWDFCCALWVAFPLFALGALISALLLLAKLITAVFFRHAYGPNLAFYAWLFLMCCGGTVMFYTIVAELTARSRLVYALTDRLFQLYVAAIVYLGAALTVHLLCRESLR